MANTQLFSTSEQEQALAESVMAFNNGPPAQPTRNVGGEAKAKPKYWVNFGSFSVDKSTGQRVFGSIGGMPLITDRFLPDNTVVGKAQLSSFNNLMTLALTLNPGESEIIECGNYAFEVRHVSDGTQPKADTGSIGNEKRDAEMAAIIARREAAKAAALKAVL